MRNLATIQKIETLSPIEGADSIEVATLENLGWYIVTRKGEYSIGDSVIYVETDSVLPDKPWSDFMRPRNFRVKIIKLRGQVSMGLILPLNILPEEFIYELSEKVSNGNVCIGEDVSEVLGIIKYEPPIPASLGGMAKGNFPLFCNKTDETRVQSLKSVIDNNRGELCYVGEKVDGSSSTFYLNNNEFGVCSRNLDLKETEGNSFWQVARRENIEEKMRLLSETKYLTNFNIAGELCGPSIQQNKYKLKDLQLYVFNVFDIDKQEYLGYDDFKCVVNTLGLQTVPIIDENFILDKNVDELVEMSKGFSKLNPNTKREGIVIRSKIEKNIHRLGRFSFKAINPEFLLKYIDD